MHTYHTRTKPQLLQLRCPYCEGQFIHLDRAVTNNNNTISVKLTCVQCDNDGNCIFIVEQHKGRIYLRWDGGFGINLEDA